MSSQWALGQSHDQSRGRGHGSWAVQGHARGMAWALLKTALMAWAKYDKYLVPKLRWLHFLVKRV